MLQSPWEKRRGAGARPGEGEFVLYLQGIPAHCRWQELKDFVRQTALHVRQAVVYDDQNGYPTGLGQIIVKNEDEAWRTYRKFATSGWDGQELTVTLARASSPTLPIAGPTKSPSTRFPALSGYPSPPGGTLNVIPPAPSLPPEPVMSTGQAYQPAEPVPAVGSRVALNHIVPANFDPMLAPQPVDTAFRYNLFTSLPYTVLSPCFKPGTIPFLPYQMPALQPANDILVNKPIFGKTIYYYHNDSSYCNTYSVNAYENFSASEFGTRRLTIHDINSGANRKSLEDLLSSVGTVDECDIFKECEFKESECYYAMATFRTEEEARWAVMQLNNSLFMGKRIRVQLHWSADCAGSDVAVDDSSEWNGSGNVDGGPLSEQSLRMRSNSEITSSKALDNELTRKKQEAAQPFVVNGSVLG